VRPAVVQKAPGGWKVQPNMLDYQLERDRFRWEDARRWLDGLPGGRGLNIAHEAVDRHALGPRADRVAIVWLVPDRRIERVTIDRTTPAD